MTAADGLALARAGLAPPIAALALSGPDGRRWALPLFVAAALTDAIDGPIARRTGGATRRGALLDATADKVLVVVVLGALAAARRAPWPAVGIIASRELAVGVLRARRTLAGSGLAPTGLARLKTVAQCLATAALLAAPLPGRRGRRLALGLLWGAVAVTVASAVQYAARSPALRRAHGG
ncbi:MAG TPA: CDP-alcohol phosphatidyltransferase family protein [Candidatus Limnocylindrales bacterium]|nr:CDP-alcohol phosphatidyltransferase family protein [Candidatus Limnocylindrales bacterium]